MPEQNFTSFVLRNKALECQVVPDLGGRIVSLRNLITGREWMWSPNRERRLFRNALGDDFASSTLTGWDECLPTIAPCSFKGRTLPDHGEVWNQAWTVERVEASSEALRMSIHLPVSRFTFTRTLRLFEDGMGVEYALTNNGADAEEYIWAMHPLLRIEDDDRLELEAGLSSALANEPWLINLTFPEAQPACAKRFIRLPSGQARVGVVNDRTTDQLRIEWDAAENDTLGLWLTRGGWHGYHHLALEPTNGGHDSLHEAARTGHCGLISPGTTKTWSVRIHLSPT